MVLCWRKSEMYFASYSCLSFSNFSLERTDVMIPMKNKILNNTLWTLMI